MGEVEKHCLGGTFLPVLPLDPHKSSSHLHVECHTGLQEKNTAFHLAAMNGHADILQKLLEAGVDLEDKNAVSIKLENMGRGFTLIGNMEM